MQKKELKVCKSGNAKVPFEVRFYEKGVLKRKRFADKLDALKFAEEKNKEVILPEVLQLGDDDRVIFSQIKALCEKHSYSLQALYEHLLNSKSIFRNLESITWKKAMELYLLHNSSYARATKEFYTNQITYLFEKNKLKNVDDILDIDINLALSRVSNQSHCMRVNKKFFKWCISVGYLNVNPFDGVEIAQELGVKQLPAVLSVARTKELLEAVPAKWKPAFALWVFVGLRPSEIIDKYRPALAVGDIDFENKRITIRGEASKMRRKPRIIVNAPNVIWKWLEPLKALPKDAQVAPASYMSYRRLKKALGADLNEKDILRHSFGTYSFFEFGESITKDIMGHGQTTTTLFKHYKGLATASDAKKYFKIAPKSKK